MRLAVCNNVNVLFAGGVLRLIRREATSLRINALGLPCRGVGGREVKGDFVGLEPSFEGNAFGRMPLLRREATCA